MNSKLVNVKDRSPNVELIKYLENLLEDAKSGEIRSIVTHIAFDDNQTSSGWRLDNRTQGQMLLAQELLGMHDLKNALLLTDQDSSTVKYI